MYYAIFLGFINNPIIKERIVGITQPNPTLAKGIKFNAVPKNENNIPHTKET